MKFETLGPWRRPAVIFAISLMVAIAARAQFAPAQGSPFAIGTNTGLVGLADFNGDGIPDVVVTDFSSRIALLSGNGTGGFSLSGDSSYTVGAGSYAISDFNGDGKPDLAVVNAANKSVTVLLGNGAGGFKAGPESPFAGTSPGAVTVGDFNGDGISDLAITDSSSTIDTASPVGNNVIVLLGNGLGGFKTAPGSPFAVGTLYPTAVAVGDFNRDGKEDLAVGFLHSQSLLTLLGDGSGGFTPLGSYPVAELIQCGVISIAVADFNRDGILDIAAACFAHIGNMSVKLGDGSGAFPKFGYGFTGEPHTISVGDFNGDGIPDIAVVQTGPIVNVLIGNGSGGFAEAPGSPYLAGFPNGPSNGGYGAAGDFNGDSKPDIAVVNPAGNSLTVLLNSLPAIKVNPASVVFEAGTGQSPPAGIPITVSSTVSGSTYTATSDEPWLTASPSSNATGSSTIVTLSVNQSSVSPGTHSGTITYSAPNFFLGAKTKVRLNVGNPSGTFVQAANSPSAAGTRPTFVAVGDFNRDAWPDLAVANPDSNNVTVLLGDPLGGFRTAAASPFAVGTHPTSIAVGDFNGDGRQDLAVVNQGSDNVTVLLGNAGQFTPAPGSPFTVGKTPTSIAVGDFNGDGKQDLSIANQGSGDVTVLLGNGLGRFTASTGSPVALGKDPVAVAVGDFNGDDKPDLAVASASGGDVKILLGNGSGGFNVLTGSILPVPFPSSIAAGDFNRDGKQDLAVASNDLTTGLTVFLGDGSGGFTPVSDTPSAGSFVDSVVVGDFNGDGVVDLALANSGTGRPNTVTVLLGNGSGGFTAAAPGAFPVGRPSSLVVSDFNLDGRLDIAVATADNDSVTLLLGALATTNSTLTTTSALTIPFGTAVPLRVTVSDTVSAFNAPTGLVTFSDGGTVVGTASQGSPYSFNLAGLAAGSHTLTAAYSGDTRSLGSTSNSITIQVNPNSQTRPGFRRFQRPPF